MFKTEMQRRQERVLDEQRKEREQREQQERADQDERVRHNAETRRQYLATLEEKREGERRRAEAEVDRQLEPEKQRARNEWLANHPYQTPTDFENTWKQFLRPNAVENLERQAYEATKQALRATGKYSF